MFTINPTVFYCIVPYCILLNQYYSRYKELAIGQRNLLHNKKHKISYKEQSNQMLQIKDPPKVGILIPKTISKFSKLNKLSKKRPPKVSKTQKQL